MRRAYEMSASDYVNRPFDSKVVYRRVYNTIKLYAKQRRLVSLVSDQIRKQEKNTSMLVGELQEGLHKNRHGHRRKTNKNKPALLLWQHSAAGERGRCFCRWKKAHSSTFSCARYCRASSRESSSNRLLPARSATVRATRKMRSWARAESPSAS